LEAAQFQIFECESDFVFFVHTMIARSIVF
jgi:hypothetical protein